MTNKATKLLAKRKLKVFTIESASAGYILHRLSLSPYSGKVLLGGIVCYDLSVKTDLLNIPVHLIEQYSPESIEITRYLIEHTQALFDADIYIACTGLLKRGGSENAQKPVGTFFYCIYFNNQIHEYSCLCKGKPEKKLRSLYSRICKDIIKLVNNKS